MQFDFLMLKFLKKKKKKERQKNKSVTYKNILN